MRWSARNIVPVPTGGRVFVVGDLLLGPLADAMSEAATGELARLLDGIEGPALVVLAGDTFDLAGAPNHCPAKALTSHPVLVRAIDRFLSLPDHRLVVLAGERDRGIVEDPELRAEVERLTGATVAETLDLEIATGCGVERVRIEHGDGLDDGTSPAGVNAQARHHALALAAEGFDGLITAHTKSAELTDLGACWYANCGCVNRIVQPRGRRFGRDDLAVELRQISWLELEAGAKLHVRLVAGQSPTVEAPLRQHLTCRAPRVVVPVRPATVATLTEGQTWPPQHLDDPNRLPRRVGAAGLALVALVNLLSVLTPPLGDRFAILDRAFPFAVPELADATVAASSVALCLLAVALRRGQRRAWVASLVLLAASAIGHVTKGLDIEEATIAVGVLAYLVANRSAFRGRGGAQDLWARIALLIAIVAGAAVTSVITIVIVARVPLHVAIPAVGERLLGIPEVALPAGPTASARCSRSSGSARSPRRSGRSCGPRGACRPRTTKRPGTSSAPRRPTRSTTSRCATTSTGSSAAAPSSRTRCTAGPPSSRRTRSALLTSAWRRGRRSDSTRPRTAGTSPCSARAWTGSPPTGPRA